MTNTKIQGKIAEDLACHYLQAQGLSLIDRNYQLRSGEIDLIMRDKQHLIFVEVRYRKTERYGGALYSIDWRKQQRIIRAAQHYLLCHPTPLAIRFDVLAIDGKQTINWLQNAFNLD